MKNEVLISIQTILNNAGVINLNKEIKQVTKSTKRFSDRLGRVSANFTAISEVAGRMKDKFVGIFGTVVDDADELRNSMVGLQSIVEGNGKDFSKAKAFIKDYISDGLVPASDAYTTYKNLIARGYDTKQVEELMRRLKDSASFGRQASLDLGEAVKSASEGLKNENSILVDNAGVTKNVSVMWAEYAKTIGKTAKTLTQEEKLEAEYQGIMKETRFQVGDATKLAKEYGGKKAKLIATTKQLSQTIGSMFLPVLAEVMDKVTPIIDNIKNWIKENPELAKTIGMIVAGIGGLLVVVAGIAPLIPIVGALGTAFTVLTGPIGLVVAGIAGLAIAYQSNFMGMQEVVNNWFASMKYTFQYVIDIVKALYNAVSEYIGRIKEPFMGVVEFLQPYVEEFLGTLFEYFSYTFGNIITVLSGAWKVIQGIFQIGVGIIGGIVEVFLNVLAGDWEGAWEGIKNMTALVWDGIKNVFGGVLKIIEGIVKQFLSTLKAIFQAGWTTIKVGASVGWNAIKNLITGIWNSLIALGKTIFKEFSNFFKNLWGGVKNTTSKAWEGLSIGLSAVWNGIWKNSIDIFTGIKESITSIFQGAVDFVMKAWEKIKGIWGWITGAKKDASSELSSARSKKASMQSQGYHNRFYGGSVVAGRSYMVGERGREMFIPETNGKIVPNSELGGNNISVTITGNNIGNEADEERLANKVIEKLNYQLQMSKFGIS